MPKPTAPIVVGLVRGIIYAGAAAVLAATTAALPDLDGTDVAPFVPIIAGAIRVAEAWLLDQRRGAPAQQGALGGKDIGTP